MEMSNLVSTLEALKLQHPGDLIVHLSLIHHMHTLDIQSELYNTQKDKQSINESVHLASSSKKNIYMRNYSQNKKVKEQPKEFNSFFCKKHDKCRIFLHISCFFAEKMWILSVVYLPSCFDKSFTQSICFYFERQQSSEHFNPILLHPLFLLYMVRYKFIVDGTLFQLSIVVHFELPKMCRERNQRQVHNQFFMKL